MCIRDRSNTAEGKALVAETSTDVFTALDRHSDRYAHETVRGPARQVIERCGSIKDTLIPEPYKI
eukprot:4488038-Prymnesium_polylepis.1